MDSQVIRQRQNEIPKLYSTDGIYFQDKQIFKRYRHFGSMSNWLMAEYSPEEQTFFGWACLKGDLENAEWGYIYEPELNSIAAELDEYWIPLYFPEAKKLVLGYREPAGTKAHYDYWRHENQRWLTDFHTRVHPMLDYDLFVEMSYKEQHGLA